MKKKKQKKPKKPRSIETLIAILHCKGGAHKNKKYRIKHKKKIEDDEEQNHQ